LKRALIASAISWATLARAPVLEGSRRMHLPETTKAGAAVNAPAFAIGGFG
jgi:hypothetical protein